MLLDLAIGYSLYFYEVGIILLGFILIAYVVGIRHKLLDKTGIYYKIIKENKGFITLISVYILSDIIGFILTGNYQIFYEKYRVVMANITLALAVVLILVENKKFSLIKRTFVIGAVITSILTLINYILINVIPVHYLLRLTLRQDYNVFAITILLGFVFGLFIPFEDSDSKKLSFITPFVISIITIPVMMLSGSRRVYIMIIPIMVIWLVVLIYSQTKKGSKILFRLSGVFCCTAITISTASLIITGLSAYIDYLYYTPNSDHSIEVVLSSETSLEERYSTTKTADAMDKRYGIWQIAVDEYSSYTNIEKIIGKGSGESIEIYNEPIDTLTTLYGNEEDYVGKLSPHNFILSDLLDGGIVRVVLALWLTLLIAIKVISYILQDFYRGLPYAIIIGALFIGLLISYRYGILYDKTLMIILGMLFVESYYRGGKTHENHNYDNISTQT